MAPHKGGGLMAYGKYKLHYHVRVSVKIYNSTLIKLRESYELIRKLSTVTYQFVLLGENRANYISNSIQSTIQARNVLFAYQVVNTGR